MTEKLKISIENLYKVFYKYPFKSQISGCPCCVSDSDKLTLHSKQLRDLQEDDISRYAFKAMSTWGDVDDFKHYLPRIFELLSTTDFVVDTFVILGKLDYGNWTDWEQDEKNAILDFLYSWWIDFISTKDYFDIEILNEINKLTHDLPKLLDLWTIDVKKNSFRCFIDFLQSEFYDIAQKTELYKDFRDSDIKYLKNWIDNNISKLEDGFFYHEKKDSEFAEQVSNILYTIERT